MRSEAKLEFLAILHFFISCCARRCNFQKTGMLPDVYDSLVIVLACERVCWFILAAGREIQDFPDSDGLIYCV